jgi:hypothetical protein
MNLLKLALLLLFTFALPFNQPVAHASDDGGCDVPITQPVGGFSVNNLAGYNPIIGYLIIQPAATGDASYIQISNTSDYSSQTAIFALTGNNIQWTFSTGYGLKNVFVHYLNSCQAMPSPTIVLEINYDPPICHEAVGAPPGGFSVTNLSGSPVSSPNIQIQLASGNAAFAEVSNYANFGSSTVYQVGYGFEGVEDWTLSSGFGLKTVYARFLNDCGLLPTAPVSVTVNYNNCISAPTPPTNGFMVTVVGSSNVKTRYVKLGMSGGDAAYMEVSNYSNFATSITYPYAATLNWSLTPGYGKKTVWARYWNGCKTFKSIAVSISLTYYP